MNWIIQVYSHDKASKTGRWITHRHQHGSKLVAHFETLGALRRFVKHHCLAIDQKARALNEITKEIREI